MSTHHPSPYSPAAAQDTIVAIATPPGRGGVGIIRVSGPLAPEIFRKLFTCAGRGPAPVPRMLHFGSIADPRTKRPLDDALAVYMPGPNSFTGEDVVEFHCHGSPLILGQVVDAAIAGGCRHAARGEFSYRAFLHGRMDLSQAEAVVEMITAGSATAATLAHKRLDGEIGRRTEALRTRLLDVRAHLCVAVDFPDDEVECLPPDAFFAEIQAVQSAVSSLLAAYERNRVWQQESRVVLAGQVNAGKSSLMNALLGHRRALVSDTPGTTRDWLEERVNLDGIIARLVDTAGLRETPDSVEIEGINHSREQIATADAVLLVVDARTGLCAPEQELLAQLGKEHRAVLVVFNKIDLPDAAPTYSPSLHCLAVSAKNGDGLDELAREVRHILLHGKGHGKEHDHSGLHGEDAADNVLAPNTRQAQALQQAHDDLTALGEALQNGIPYDLAAVHLDAAVAALAEITGHTAPDDVLNRVFSEFCIGK